MDITLNRITATAGVSAAVAGTSFGAVQINHPPARWAPVLFAAGAVSALALATLPESFSRPFAVPVEVALDGLGVSMWRTSRPRGGVTTTPTASAEPAAVAAIRDLGVTLIAVTPAGSLHTTTEKE